MIFNKKNLLTIKDDALGLLKFYEDKISPEDSYWECRRSMTFNVKNDKNGISTKQRNHVKLIEERLPELMPQIQEYINQNAGKAYEIDKNIEISWIELENDNTQELLWTIDFEFKNRWEHLVVEMKNWTPFHLSFWS